MQPIYLDYAATTPVDSRVKDKLCQFLGQDGIFANPASDHVLGHVARHAVELARDQVASLIQAEPSELIWTSGATEANNLAIKGAAELHQRKGKHLITLRTEHKTILDSCQEMEKRGFAVTYLNPEPNGVLDLTTLEAAFREDTILVSIMQVNNELGVIQNIPAIAEMTAARGILLHVDAAQSAGKLPIDLKRVPVDLMSLCAHKIYGPKGIGALYLRKKPRVRVAAQIHGGGQEQGLRSGTLATHQIVAMGEAFALAQKEREQDYKQAQACRKLFLEGLADLPHVLHTDLKASLPHILNLRFGELPANRLLRLLPDVVLSTSSACMQSTQSSHVLRALGLKEDASRAALRFSFGRYTTAADIQFTLKQLHEAVAALSS